MGCTLQHEARFANAMSNTPARIVWSSGVTCRAVLLDSALHLLVLNSEIQPLVDQLRAGDLRALARAISTVENRTARLVRTAQDSLSAQRTGADTRTHRPTRCRKKHISRSTSPTLSQRKSDRWHHRGRSYESLHWRRDSGRSHPDAGAFFRPRNLHSKHGDPRFPRRTGSHYGRCRHSTRCLGTRSGDD